MIQPLLSILIPTVVGRENELSKLLGLLSKYAPLDVKSNLKKNNFDYTGTKYDLEDVEIIVVKDNKQNTIGAKREYMYSLANGLYSQMTDDDDELAPNAIELILNAIKSNPDVDVISFEEYVNMDGKEYRSNHAAIYSGWEGDGNSIFPDGFHFHRTPFFKSVIRTELAKSIPIQKIRFGEDHAFANDLHPLIKSEFHISEPLYRYIHRSSDHNTRYGIKD